MQKRQDGGGRNRARPSNQAPRGNCVSVRRDNVRGIGEDLFRYYVGRGHQYAKNIATVSGLDLAVAFQLTAIR
jgi:hypothetical protein